MLASVDSPELTKWEAWDKLYPLGAESRLIASLCSIVWNQLSRGEKFTPQQFWGCVEQPTEPEYQDPETTRRLFHSCVAGLNVE